METMAKVVHFFATKILKKRRRSIGHRGVDDLKGRLPPPPPPLPPLSMDDTVDEKSQSPPATPAHLRSREILRAATPVRTHGILVYEGESTRERDQNDAVSQAESCVDWEEWNEPAHDVAIDSPSEFAISGGDDSTSIGCEEEEEMIEPVEEYCKPGEFIFDQEFEEDDFDKIADYQKTFPVQKKMNKESYWQPVHMVEDEEGFYWDEPVGYSNPALAPPVPSPLAFPALCNYDEEALAKVAKRVMEEDEMGMKEEETKKITKKKADATYIVGVSPSISPSVRPDTPTTTREEEEESSVASGGSECDGPSDLSVITSSSPFFPSRPDDAKEEDFEYLRSVYEKSGLTHLIPEWMKSDPSKKVAQRPLATSTPVVVMNSPLAFSSISTIGGGRGLKLEDSNLTISSPRVDGSLLSIAGKTYDLDVGVRARVALMKETGLYYQTVFVDEEEDE